MFYLNCFLKAIKQYPIRGIIFLLTSSLLFLIGYQGDYLQKKFWQYYGEDLFYPYFYVIFQEEKNISLAQKYLAKLPGIVKIYVQDKENLNNAVRKSFNELNLPTIVTSELDNNFYGLKVVLEPDLSIASTGLIKKYIDHLFKNGNISTTPIKTRYKTNDKYDKSIVILMKKWGGKFILILILILWPLSYFIFMTPNKKLFYLLEIYQRRSHIGIKSIVPGIIIINLLIGIISLFFSHPSYIGIVFLLILCLLIIITIEYKKYDCFDKL
ncbi:MAG: hypothetical protein HQK51_18040 [Oligoflexia bacterium]|nr:hypothetical protein [Oligoflexia bacterium]